jgi:CdiI immunity protein
MKHLEALGQLLGGYLHEDWADDYPDLWHAIDDFVDGEPEWAPRLRAHVEQVLNQCPTEQEIQQSLRELGMVYYPQGDGWNSYRDWLRAVADRVEETLRKSPAA